MSVTRMGATKKYSDNWENIFGRGKSGSPKSAAVKPGKQSAKKKTAKSAKKASSTKTAKSRGRKKSR